MRTIVVTSALTFVPENYDRMICRMAEHPSVIGLLILDNKSSDVILRALFLIVSLSAPRLGWTLIKNYFGNSYGRRRAAYHSQGKKIWLLKTINCEDALKIFDQEKIDLIINSRTRFIYNQKILSAPRLGCINIHHGLLPLQRGLMCDFWAHLENDDFGFSIHQMTKKIDDGPILKVVKVDSPRTSYLDSIRRASEQEALACMQLLDEISRAGGFETTSSTINKVIYRKNPSLFDGYRLQIKGIKT